MNGYSIGVDCELVSRFEKSKYENYCKKILSADEVLYFNNLCGTKKQRFIASRFSAKEAIFKAIGIGISTIKFSDITILPDHLGKPIVHMNNYDIQVSISYCNNTVTTFVIAKKKEC